MLISGDNRQENDVEHSYSLAMLAWYIAETEQLNLDTDLIVKYALVHDLVEAYAGDTYIFDKDNNRHKNKNHRELESAEKLKSQFPEFETLHNLIKRYEVRNDAESKFVYALDKLHPMINIRLDNGRTWQKMGVTLQMLVDAKKQKVALSPPVQKIFEKLVSEIRKHEPELFKLN